MRNFTPHITPVYPPNNEVIFEEWLYMTYKGCNTDRKLLPVLFTPFYVNNDYGNDKQARKELHDFLGQLDKSVKYWTCIQYDDGSMIDWRLFGLDVLEFNMSKQNGVMLPLICMPHPYNFTPIKKYLVNFIGSRTHPIRNELEKFKGQEDWYISYDRHEIEDYCRVISESVYTLCPRGYGANSFRICEAMQYGSIPIYISDEFILPFASNFEEYGILLHASKIDNLKLMVDRRFGWVNKEGIENYYNDIYTYQGCYNNIIKSLEAEYTQRTK